MALRQREAGTPIQEIRRKKSMAEATSFRRNITYPDLGLGITELRELPQVQDENRYRNTSSVSDYTPGP